MEVIRLKSFNGNTLWSFEKIVLITHKNDFNIGIGKVDEGMTDELEPLIQSLHSQARIGCSGRWGHGSVCEDTP